jgi:hypothetical protein
MFCQNDQIHNNLYLAVGNSIEIGKGYQVIEKWVFFKLLFQILQTDSSGGKNHSKKANDQVISPHNFFKFNFELSNAPFQKSLMISCQILTKQFTNDHFGHFFPKFYLKNMSTLFHIFCRMD